MSPSFRRALRIFRAHIIYRLDQILGGPPLAQLAIIFAFTALLVACFALFRGGDVLGSLWWAGTRFLDGGTLSNDRTERALAVIVTVTGIAAVSLLTAALASKMGERISDLRSGLNPVMEHGHVLVLGYDANVPLFAREIARSRQRCTLVVLATVDKDRIDASLRPVRRIPGSRLKLVVRTGDPRSEHALLRVGAQWARAVVIVPPPDLDEEHTVRWSLAALLAMRRMSDEGFRGHVIIEARRRASRELLELVGEPGIVGPSSLSIDVVATDDVIACVLAQSTRDEAVYFVLRRLLAFDGCEPYLVRVPRELRGKSFDDAHATIDNAIPIGVLRAGKQLTLCPRADEIAALDEADMLVVLAAGPCDVTLGARLPKVERPIERAASAEPRDVTIVGCTATLPHLLLELDVGLPEGSHVGVVSAASSRAEEIVRTARAHTRHVQIEHRAGRPSALALGGAMCGSDVVVILGHEDVTDEDGDASALALLLQLRRGMKVSGRHDVRVVTELRDPRSAAHVAPRTGDCVVSGDVVALLLAQEALMPEIAPVYRELLHPGGASVELRSRDAFVGPTFAHVCAEARTRGEIAIGLFPDPRTRGREGEIERLRLEEGEGAGAIDAWVHPPRGTAIDDSARIVVIARPS